MQLVFKMTDILKIKNPKLPKRVTFLTRNAEGLNMNVVSLTESACQSIMQPVKSEILLSHVTITSTPLSPRLCEVTPPSATPQLHRTL